MIAMIVPSWGVIGLVAVVTMGATLYQFRKGCFIVKPVRRALLLVLMVIVCNYKQPFA
jgi:hypothetical protein